MADSMPANGWVPLRVDTSPTPVHGEHILVLCGHGERRARYVATYYGSLQWLVQVFPSGEWLQATHWQPLPELPQP